MEKKRREGETEERLLPRVRLISAGSYHAKVNVIHWNVKGVILSMLQRIGSLFLSLHTPLSLPPYLPELRDLLVRVLLLPVAPLSLLLLPPTVRRRPQHLNRNDHRGEGTRGVSDGMSISF